MCFPYADISRLSSTRAASMLCGPDGARGHVHARGGRQLQTTAAAQSEHTPSWGVWTFPKAQAFWHLAAALRLFGRCVSLALRRVVGAWPCSVCVSVV